LWQNRRRKANALGALPTAVAHARATHGDPAYAGHDLALGQMPVAHEPLATVVGQLVGMGAEQGCNLGPACVSSARAPLRNTSVSGSAKAPGWESWKTLVSVTAYHSFGGEVEARTPPRYAALPFHAVTNFRT
jgi:hypothetical protein